MADKKDKHKGAEARSRADQVRAAVEQAFGATAQSAGPFRERAQEIADELVGAAGRVRDMVEELRIPGLDELSVLRDRVTALERRVAELEAAAAAPPPAAKRATGGRSTAAKRATAGRSTAAKRPAAGSRKPPAA